MDQTNPKKYVGPAIDFETGEIIPLTTPEEQAQGILYKDEHVHDSTNDEEENTNIRNMNPDALAIETKNRDDIKSKVLAAVAVHHKKKKKTQDPADIEESVYILDTGSKYLWDFDVSPEDLKQNISATSNTYISSLGQNMLDSTITNITDKLLENSIKESLTDKARQVGASSDEDIDRSINLKTKLQNMQKGLSARTSGAIKATSQAAEDFVNKHVQAPNAPAEGLLHALTTVRNQKSTRVHDSILTKTRNPYILELMNIGIFPKKLTEATYTKKAATAEKIINSAPSTVPSKIGNTDTEEPIQNTAINPKKLDKNIPPTVFVHKPQSAKIHKLLSTQLPEVASTLEKMHGMQQVKATDNEDDVLQKLEPITCTTPNCGELATVVGISGKGKTARAKKVGISIFTQRDEEGKEFPQLSLSTQKDGVHEQYTGASTIKPYCEDCAKQHSANPIHSVFSEHLIQHHLGEGRPRFPHGSKNTSSPLVNVTPENSFTPDALFTEILKQKSPIVFGDFEGVALGKNPQYKKAPYASAATMKTTEELKKEKFLADATAYYGKDNTRIAKLKKLFSISGKQKNTPDISRNTLAGGK